MLNTLYDMMITKVDVDHISSQNELRLYGYTPSVLTRMYLDDF
jgi:hypothetical protein